ncbi:MAG: hypothetical protein ABJE95_15205 [Byssovorax sp.]
MNAKTIEFFRDRDLMIFLSCRRQPSAREWDEYAGAVRATMTSPQPLSGVLVLSEGGGPDAKQRAQVVKAFGPTPVPLAICSTSMMERGVVTAMSWIYRARTASFHFDDLAGALRHLAIGEARWSSQRQKIRAAQRLLGWRAVAAL